MPAGGRGTAWSLVRASSVCGRTVSEAEEHQDVALIPVRDVLCRSFAEQAGRTWRLMSDGARYKLLPGEETLTDLNLLQLKRRCPDLVYTEKFTRYREGKDTGADWEWWIARRDRWLGMRIQAKRLDPQSQRYELFRADRTKALQQADMLIAAAAAGPERLYPLYCFYNTGCPTPDKPRCSPNGDGLVYGCTLLAAPTVRELVARGATYYSDFAPHAIPWSCLFCDDGYDNPEADLVDAAQWTLDDRLFGDLREVRGVVVDEVPEYVEAVWRTPEPLVLPGQIDMRTVPDVSHILLTTGMQPRPPFG